MKENQKSAGGSGGKKEPAISRGILVGIAILIIAIVVFAVMLTGSSGTSSGDCNDNAGACAITTTLTTKVTATTIVPVKSDRPSVKIYVMSFCPFGVQAETMIKPVVGLLSASADFETHYIATVPGADLSTAKSLHGNAEAIEDARQLCIVKHAPEKFWDYIAAFNSQCYPVYNNQSLLAACQAKVTSDLGIADSVNSCISGSEGYELLKNDTTITKNAGISSSPTILINGQKYTGQRVPEAIKSAICERYTTAPGSCSMMLSNQTAAASGNC